MGPEAQRRAGALALLHHRKGVAGGILEPGDGVGAGPGNAAGVGLHRPAGVVLETHPSPFQLGDRPVDVGHFEVQYGVAGRGVIRLAIEHDACPAGQPQGQQGVAVNGLLLHVQAEDVAIEALGGGDVYLLGILGLMLGKDFIINALVLGVLFGGIVSLIFIIALLVRRRYSGDALMTFIPYGPYFIIAAFYMLFL
mgnify:CR=1 FL=1